MNNRFGRKMWVSREGRRARRSFLFVGSHSVLVSLHGKGFGEMNSGHEMCEHRDAIGTLSGKAHRGGQFII